MKKHYPTYIHASCLNFDRIYVSAGQRGLQLKINPTDLIKTVSAEVAELVGEFVFQKWNPFTLGIPIPIVSPSD